MLGNNLCFNEARAGQIRVIESVQVFGTMRLFHRLARGRTQVISPTNFCTASISRMSKSAFKINGLPV